MRVVTTGRRPATREAVLGACWWRPRWPQMNGAPATKLMEDPWFSGEEPREKLTTVAARRGAQTARPSSPDAAPQPPRHPLSRTHMPGRAHRGAPSAGAGWSWASRGGSRVQAVTLARELTLAGAAGGRGCPRRAGVRAPLTSRRSPGAPPFPRCTPGRPALTSAWRGTRTIVSAPRPPTCWPAPPPAWPTTCCGHAAGHGGASSSARR